MNKTIISIIIGGVVIAGGSFYGGMKYDQGQNPAPAQGVGRFTNFGGGRRNGSRSGDGFAGGDIIGKDDKSITVKMNDGSSKIIFFSSSTRILQSTQGSPKDLAVGKQVTTNGTANPDGSITAQSIQIRPTDMTVNPKTQP